jgi:2-polyprenyl-3-methyl-5-hydroxy-6-metoxy-1,4-benzoquinol methylase
MLPIDPSRLDSFGCYDSLGSLVVRQAVASPRHIPFFTRRFSTSRETELRLCDELARQIYRLAGGDIDEFVKGYDFICDIQTREEIYFRRNNRYRLKTVADAVKEVYGNRDYMRSYMRGLLMTQVFWSNHTASMDFFINQMLARNPADYSLLEIGPGHGLLFSRAATDPRAGSLVGWDLSPASIAESQEALHRLGVERPIQLEVRDLFESGYSGPGFDAIVLSEVLEHLEQPGRALESIRALMRPPARMYINVPINSPAPDHLFLLRSPEEAVSFVQQYGFQIERTGFFPATNYSLEAARKHALTVSVCIIAVKPES